MDSKIKNTDDYIKSFPKDVRQRLDQIRAIIKHTAPDVDEAISYGMPAYKLNGKPLIYFGAFKNHIGFYATPSGHSEFAKELSKYKKGKGSVQFPLDKPFPIGLITKIVKFRTKENLQKQK